MKAIFLNLIFTAIRRIITAELYAEILTLVKLQMTSTLSGPEKKAAVLAALQAAKSTFQSNLGETASWILSLAVDVAVAEVNKLAGKPLTTGA